MMIEKLLELEGADAGHRGEGSLSFLAAETSLDAEVVHKLALGQVGALGLDGGQRSLALRSGLLHGLGHYGMLIELLSIVYKRVNKGAGVGNHQHQKNKYNSKN